MMVVSLEYNEEKGVLDARHHDNSVERYYLVLPKVYEKSYDEATPEDFIRKHVRGQFPMVRI